MMLKQNIGKLSFLLFISSFFIFFGRGCQLLFWEAPFREVFWDQSLMKPLIEGVFNKNWHEYVTSQETNNLIYNVVKFFGVVFILSAIASAVLYFFKKKVVVPIIYIGSLFMFIIIFLEFKEKFYNSAQLIEGTIQVGAPILFVLWSLKKISIEKLGLWLKIIIVLTFVGHGLYAVGVYETPGKFIDMTIILLGIKENPSVIFLMVVGILDILILPFLFIKKLKIPILWYAVVWGVITSFARIVYYLKLKHYQLDTFYMVHDTLFRLAHGLIPLALLYLLKVKTENKLKL